VEVREGRHPWWAFSRYAAGHAYLFEKPKVLWQEIQFHSWFAIVTGAAIANNKVFFVPSDDLALLGVLCSPLMWWHFTRVLPHMKDEALSPAGFMMEGIHLTTGSAAQAQRLRDAVRRLLEVTQAVNEWRRVTVEAATKGFGLPEADERVLDWLSVSGEFFVTRSLRFAGVKQPTTKLKEELAAFHLKHRTRQVELLTRQLELEKQLAALVEDAYDLTPDERALLRATRPVRDPIDVLEAKIRGRSDGPAGPGENCS
jgi:hypothetical protein